MSARKVSRMEHVSEKADLARRSIPLTVTKGLFPESEMSTVSGESRGNEPGGSSPLASIDALRQALGIYFLAMTTGTASRWPSLVRISRSVLESGL